MYPAVAVADALVARRKDVKMAFVGADPPREEARAMPKAGYGVPWTVPAPRMKLDWTFPWRATRAVVLATRHLVRFRPDVVVGTGGYVAAPTCVAAALLRVPLLLVEPNARPGKTNRWLARIAERTCVAFPEAMQHLPSPLAVLVTGTPTRTSVQNANRTDKTGAKMELVYGGKWKEMEVESDRPGQVVCAFGGSLGAARINQAVVDALPGWLNRNGLFLLWQTGPNHYQDVLQQLQVDQSGHPSEVADEPEHPCGFLAFARDGQSLPGLRSEGRHQEGRGANPRQPDPQAGTDGAKVAVVPFVDRMDLAYAAADVVVARAGAITCAELLAAGVPSILVPAPNVAEDHQTFNAQAMESSGASIMVKDGDLDSGVLKGAVMGLLEDRAKREEMARAALKAARPDAADAVAREILLLAVIQQKKQERRWGWLKGMRKMVLQR